LENKHLDIHNGDTEMINDVTSYKVLAQIDQFVSETSDKQVNDSLNIHYGDTEKCFKIIQIK